MLDSSALDGGTERPEPWSRAELDETPQTTGAPLKMLGRRTAVSVRPCVKQRILTAAADAVADRGLDGLSMEDVAVRAGCSRATVYRRMGGRDALLDSVLDETICRITASVAEAIAPLQGVERVVRMIVASLEIVRADPVAAALLNGPAAAHTVNNALITGLTGTIASMTGLAASDRVGCELIARLTLSLLCWPAADRDFELEVIRRHVLADRASLTLQT